MTRAGGHTLLEALVALAVVNIALLGFLFSQQQREQRGDNLSAHAFAVAALHDMAAHLAMNPDGGDAFVSAYDDPPPAAPACDTRRCGAAELARYQLAQWKCRFDAWAENAACKNLPSAFTLGGDGRVQRNGGNFEIAARRDAGGEQFVVSITRGRLE